MNDMLMAENMSNLTTASGEISASSSTRNETTGTLYSQQSSASTNLAPPPKRKRNLPGNPGLVSLQRVGHTCLIIVTSIIWVIVIILTQKKLTLSYGFSIFLVFKQTQKQK